MLVTKAKQVYLAEMRFSEDTLPGSTLLHRIAHGLASKVLQLAEFPHLFVWHTDLPSCKRQDTVPIAPFPHTFPSLLLSLVLGKSAFSLSAWLMRHMSVAMDQTPGHSTLQHGID